MSAERLTVWLEPFDAAIAARVGVLCRRHADAMVVPNRWTLDDRRPLSPPPEAEPAVVRVLIAEPPVEPEAEPSTAPQLFDSPAAGGGSDKPAKGRSRRRKSADETGQLDLLALAPEPAGAQPVEPAEQPAAPAVADPDEPPVAPWKPVFDQDSDLEGLLDVRSPLLSRAFRGGSPKP